MCARCCLCGNISLDSPICRSVKIVNRGRRANSDCHSSLLNQSKKGSDSQRRNEDEMMLMIFKKSLVVGDIESIRCYIENDINIDNNNINEIDIDEKNGFLRSDHPQITQRCTNNRRNNSHTTFFVECSKCKDFFRIFILSVPQTSTPNLKVSSLSSIDARSMLSTSGANNNNNSKLLCSENSDNTFNSTDIPRFSPSPLNIADSHSVTNVDYDNSEESCLPARSDHRISNGISGAPFSHNISQVPKFSSLDMSRIKPKRSLDGKTETLLNRRQSSDTQSQQIILEKRGSSTDLLLQGRFRECNHFPDELKDVFKLTEEQLRKVSTKCQTPLKKDEEAFWCEDPDIEFMFSAKSRTRSSPFDMHF